MTSAPPGGPPTPSQTDICLLVRSGDVAAVRRCLQECPALIRRERWSGVTALHRAVGAGDRAMTRELLVFGANVNACASWGGYTPLHLACKQGDEALINVLLEHGASWSKTDKANKTPLQWAVRAGKASVAYRIDQQLHVRAKATKAEEIERANTLAAKSRGSTPVTMSSLCL